MYEMSQRHPVWVAENHVNPCNSVILCPGFDLTLVETVCHIVNTVSKACKNSKTIVFTV